MYALKYRVKCQCVVPENIHTPPTEGIGNSWGVGSSQRPKTLSKCMKLLSKNPFHGGGLKVIHGITPAVYIWLMFIGLAPETNLEKAFADMVVDAVMDIRAKARKCRFETDAALKVNILINVSALVLKMFDSLISIQSFWC